MRATARGRRLRGQYVERGLQPAASIGDTRRGKPHLDAGERAEQREVVEMAKVADPNFPGLMLILIALSVNLLGDWLRDALNPRLR